jgi:hypothetical protein
MNIGSELAIIVHESMLEARNANYEKIEPLMFFRVRHEREQALAKVSKLLLDQPVTWQNLSEVFVKSLDFAKCGKVCWERSPEHAIAK